MLETNGTEAAAEAAWTLEVEDLDQRGLGDVRYCLCSREDCEQA